MSFPAVCDACVAALELTGSWLTLMTSPAERERAYASDPLAASLEESQFTLGEGPCEEAFASGLPVLASDLDSEESLQRWPVFAPAAVQSTARALFAFPLRKGAVQLGVFATYRDSAGALLPDQIADAQVFADLVLNLVLDAQSHGSGHTAHWLNDDGSLGGAVVHQATGMVAVQLRVDLGEALVRLRAHAFANQLPLAEVAAGVVNRTLRFSRGVDADPL
ncbi:GAF domain-containing protein [Kutzneria viridogrisea]|uniref:GAF domain-containing protein n=1 Tax=Kutzneria viridogrisea TaxID=47990 RepID=UPI00046CAA24